MPLDWQIFDTWIVVIAGLCALSCALLGNYLVLRGMSMMGDAITHAVLPGIGGAFLAIGLLQGASQEAGWIARAWPALADWLQTLHPRSAPAMLLGAVIAGLATTLFTQWIQSFGQVDRGAAMGVVFTTLFALGLILVVQTANHVDLDPNCVLYGAVELAPLDEVQLWGTGWFVPRAAVVLSAVLGLNLLFIALFYKEMKLAAFDPALATTLGFSAQRMHYALMVLVAITTVASFEVVGSILVVAMLIVPPAAAWLLTDRLGPMIVLSAVLALFSALLGHLTAITLPSLVFQGAESTSTAGMMAVATGTLFGICLLLAPRHGLIGRGWRRFQLRLRIAREDILALLYRLEEAVPLDRALAGAPTARTLRRVTGTGRLVNHLALGQLERRGKILPVTTDRPGYRLTDPGRRHGRRVIRSHRLWEAFLHQQVGIRPDHVHRTASELEHLTDPATTASLLQAVGETRRDPQGRPIPPAEPPREA